jgi:hypothetical protein
VHGFIETFGIKEKFELDQPLKSAFVGSVSLDICKMTISFVDVPWILR